MKKDEKAAAQSGAVNVVLGNRDTRHSMLLAGNIRRIDSDTWEKALCRNLSRNGMRANCEHSWSIGTHVVCELRGVGVVPGKIIWVHGKAVGIRFDGAIDPRLVWKAAREPGESAHLARYLHFKPASHNRPAITLRSHHSRGKSRRA